jgi:hypothetical protein
MLIFSKSLQLERQPQDEHWNLGQQVSSSILTTEYL